MPPSKPGPVAAPPPAAKPAPVAGKRAEPTYIPEPPPYDPEPGPAFEPEPPPPYEPPPSTAPLRTEKGEPKKSAIVAADEGEFWHLKATAEKGLELQGKIVRYLRKSDAPASARVMRYLAHGVTVRERDEYIAFISPDDVFLQMGDNSVMSVISAALDALDIKKRARIERTENDMFLMDVEKAKRLFSRDGVIVN